MADISEELERLAGLRDRGILTSEEFALQKARLLEATAAPAAPVAVAPRSVAPNAEGLMRHALLYGAIVAVLVLIGAGVAGQMGAFSSPKPYVGGSSFNAGSTSPGTVTPSSATAVPIPSTVAPSDNPMLGTWLADGRNPECPSRVTVTATDIDAVMPDGTHDVQRTAYKVLGANSVIVSFLGGVTLSKSASIDEGKLSYQSCGFTRG